VAALALLLASCGGESSLRVAVAPPAPATPSAQEPAATIPGRPSLQATAKPSSSSLPAAASGGSLPAASRLKIPAIGVDAPLITLGVDPDGSMQVPINGTDVGWYSFSAVPGKPGNAVLSGHLDTATSRTAVFSRLKEMTQGDAVSVTANGQTTRFEVFWTKSWPDAAAPLSLILGNAPSPTLTLITCAGTFDRASRNYSERLVVRAKLPGSV
jgi:LPXTG-site transpeptidase (sortase) family protein